MFSFVSHTKQINPNFYSSPITGKG